VEAWPDLPTSRAPSPAWLRARHGERRLGAFAWASTSSGVLVSLLTMPSSYGNPTGLPGFLPGTKGYFACPDKLHVKHTRERRPICTKCRPNVAMQRISREEYLRLKPR
jgi:hypothetical protein